MSIRVEALAPDGADRALADGVCSGCPDRGLDGSDALGCEHGVEGGGELAVPVPEEELDRAGLIGEFHTEVPGLLGHPVGDRLGRDTSDPD
jgi:hypothetical protein